MNRRIALIPARGGSKRLPRKNILDFYGKPMIAHSIKAAHETALFDEVVVSTEDDEIAKIAMQFGAVVEKRLPDLSTDLSTVKEVCFQYLKYHSVTTLVVLYATAPLRNAFDIHSVVGLLSDKCHFAMAATRCDWPVHQTLKLEDDRVKPLFPNLLHCRADEVGDYCIDNGSTYAVNVSAFLQQKTFYGDDLKVYLMPNARSIDIDTPEDYRRALYQAENALV